MQKLKHFLLIFSIALIVSCSSSDEQISVEILTANDLCSVTQNQPKECLILENDNFDTNSAVEIYIEQSPQFGALTINAHSITYRPAEGYAGQDSFSYVISQNNTQSRPAQVDITVQRVSPQVAVYTAGWENGQTHSGLPGKLTPSFSNDVTSLTEEHSDIHYYQVDKVDWARSGNHVLKFFGEPPAFRSETAFMDALYRYRQGDEFYFSASIRPDDSWDEPTKYSIIISQWKSFSSGPHAALRLSNMGDYVLSYHSKDHPAVELGIAPANEWTDVRIYFKKSLNDDGKVMVWVNGELKLERHGKTLISSNEGYTKIGMYTEIRSPRTLYFDNVSVSKGINRPLLDWGSSPVDGNFDDSDEDGIANGLDPYPYDPDRF
ncbi:heparin lyase I family protein [Paraferrimonas sp. SM1919]|uniref:heparin lyase I family protein n=1 Tax=Paraferrimonas sp. SM1919 TaxID=2662263 RepID=UPI0013CFFF86|nr:heparin lyase I family protein [Paraferrimonas sp. SM1919]